PDGAVLPRHGRQVRRLARRPPDARFRNVVRVSEPHAAAAERADSQSARARFLHVLDLAAADPDLEAGHLRERGVRVGGARLERGLHGAAGEFEIGHAVPPIVIDEIFTVGMPTPTGTFWPSLPHTHVRSESFASLPSISTRDITSGPLPMSVTSRRGAVTRPSSMR